MAYAVERRIVDLGRETVRFAVQLQTLKHRRIQETGHRGKLGVREGNHPDYS